MSIGMSLLAILDEQPAYGLQLKNEFEERTGGIFPLNVGQVYTTLGRMERDGLVRQAPDDGEREVVYEITAGGRRRLAEWFAGATAEAKASRDELVLKIVMVASRPNDATRVIQAERKAALQTLQSYTRLKREAPRDADLGWTLLLDSLIFQSEARIRWLDTCETRLARAKTQMSSKAHGRRVVKTEVRHDSRP